jgi:hypothetical protein
MASNKIFPHFAPQNYLPLGAFIKISAECLNTFKNSIKNLLLPGMELMPVIPRDGLGIWV